MKKRFLILICFCICALELFAEHVGIISFNINGDFNGTHNSYNEKWVNRIYNTIIENNPDIILLQEFPIKSQNEALLNMLINKLGNNWAYYNTEKYLRKGEGGNQNNIVFYNLEKILPCPEEDFIIDFSGDSCKYQFAKNNYQVIHFCLASNAKSDFILVNLHIPSSNYEKKQSDVQQLEIMFSELKAKYKIVMAGDFNIDRASLLTMFPDSTVDGKNGRYFFLPESNQYNPLKTTLKQDNRIVRLNNDFDHFVIYNIPIINEMQHSFIKNTGRSLEYGEDTYGNGITVGGEYYKSSDDFDSKVSDHVPIYMILDL